MMYSRRWNLILAVILLLEGANSIVLDLGHGYYNQTTTCWNPTEQFRIFGVSSGNRSNGQWYITEKFSTEEHCGTHLDAPYHFGADGWKLDEIPLERMIAEGKSSISFISL